jgi:hypothetical protein
MNLYLYIWTSLGYFFSRRSFRNARILHTSFLNSTVFSQEEILIALELYGTDFTRLETVYLLRPRQKYHTIHYTRNNQSGFARGLVQQEYLNEEVAR